MFNHAAAIGIDLGTFSLKVAVVKSGGEIVAVKSFPLHPKQTKEYLISMIFDAVQEIRKSVTPMGINPICIGIAAKGFIDHKAGIVIGPDHGIKNWTNVLLAKKVKKKSGLPVYVGNDANMMTIAEHVFGAAKRFKNIVFIALRTGIGGGIIIEGKLYRGVNNAGGEIGQMIINYDGSVSEIGIRGSFEHLASGSAIVRRYYEEAGTGADNSSARLTCKEIFELSYENFPVAVKVVKENAEMVGVGLANLIAIFAPEIIVIGGGMSEAHDNYFDMIKESIFANSLENCRSEVRIERAHLGSKAAFMGAAYYSLIRLAGKSF